MSGFEPATLLDVESSEQIYLLTLVVTGADNFCVKRFFVCLEVVTVLLWTPTFGADLTWKESDTKRAWELVDASEYLAFIFNPKHYVSITTGTKNGPLTGLAGHWKLSKDQLKLSIWGGSGYSVEYRKLETIRLNALTVRDQTGKTLTFKLK